MLHLQSRHGGLKIVDNLIGSTLLENPQYFEPKIKNKPIFSQQRTSTCSHERVNERKTNPTQQITRSHGYTSYLSGD